MLRVINRTRGTILADRAEEATGFFARFRGLMGRKELPVGHGLHLCPCNAIHTFFMRMPIDALFLDEGARVVKALRALPPWRATAVCLRSKSVLELPAGALATTHTSEGDEIAFEPAPGEAGERED